MVTTLRNFITSVPPLTPAATPRLDNEPGQAQTPPSAFQIHEQRQEGGIGILSLGDYTRSPNNTFNHKVQSDQNQGSSPDARHAATPSTESDSSLVATPPLQLDIGPNDEVDIQESHRGDGEWLYNIDTCGRYTTGNDSRAESSPADVHPCQGLIPSKQDEVQNASGNEHPAVT